MKKRFLSLFLSAILLMVPLTTFGDAPFLKEDAPSVAPILEEDILPAANGFFIPSKTQEFTQMAIDAQHRLKTTYQVYANEEAADNLDTDFGLLAAFINNSSLEILFQPDYDGTYFWQQTASLGGESFLNHSLITTPEDSFFTTNFLPGEILAFTPKELVSFISTLLNTGMKELESLDDDSLDENIFSANLLLSSLSYFITEGATWADVGDLLLPEEISALEDFFLTQSLEEMLVLFDSMGLPSLSPLFDEVMDWFEKTKVPTPVISSIEGLPLGSTIHQHQINRTDINQLIDIFFDWFSQAEVASFLSAFASSSSSYQSFTAKDMADALEYLRDTLQENLEDHFTGPVTLTYWATELESGSSRLDQLTLIYTMFPYYGNYSDPSITFFFNYAFDQEPMPQYAFSYGLFDETNRMHLELNLLPQHTLSEPGSDDEEKQAQILFSAVLETKEQDIYTLLDQVTLSVSQEQTATDTSSDESLHISLAFSSLKDSDDTPYYSMLDLNGGIFFAADTHTTFNETSNIKSTTNYSLSLEGDLGEGDLGSQELLSIRKDLVSSQPRQVIIPKPSQTTRLGQMTFKQMNSWFNKHSNSIMDALETFFAFFEGFN